MTLARIVGFCSVIPTIAGALAAQFATAPAGILMPTQQAHWRSTSAQGHAYAYAADIFYHNNMYHMYYCGNSFAGSYAGHYEFTATVGSSTVDPTIPAEDDANYDFVYYSSSVLGDIWAPPKIAVRTVGWDDGADPIQHLAVCDPSVIFNSSDGYYYMYYADRDSINGVDGKNIIRLARSQAPEGPFLTLRTDGTYRSSTVRTPLPKDIVTQVHPSGPGPDWLGAGWPSAHKIGNWFVLYYFDDSQPPSHGASVLKYKISTDLTFASVASIDVLDELGEPFNELSTNGYARNDYIGTEFRLDTQALAMVMAHIPNRHNSTPPAYPKIVGRLGGLTSFSAEITLVPDNATSPGGLPPGAHNLGMIGDELGNIRYPQAYGQTLFTYGAYSDFTPEARWGSITEAFSHWDLAGHLVNLAGPIVGDTWNQIAWSWQWNDWYGEDDPAVAGIMMGLMRRNQIADTKFAIADFDGDGRADRSALRFYVSSFPNPQLDTEWYAISSAQSPFTETGTQAGDRGIDAQAWSYPQSHASIGSDALPVCGPWDNDSLEDRAVLHTSTGKVSVWNSSAPANNFDGWTFPSNPFPNSDLTPVFCDFTGDGLVDPAVINQSNGEIYIVRSDTGLPWNSGSMSYPQSWPGTWPNSPDIVCGQYLAGPGFEIGVVDRQTGKLFMFDPKTGATSTPVIPTSGWQFPGPTTLSPVFASGLTSDDVLAFADYNGDGLTDPGIVRVLSNVGYWMLVDGATGSAFGAGSHTPWEWAWQGQTLNHYILTADYDGDGMADPTIVDMNVSIMPTYFPEPDNFINPFNLYLRRDSRHTWFVRATSRMKL